MRRRRMFCGYEILPVLGRTRTDCKLNPALVTAVPTRAVSLTSGHAVSVERLRAVDPKALAFVSVDYAVLIAKKENFKSSLLKFVDTYSNEFWRDRFQGFEIRGVPLADYLDDVKMAALNTIVNVRVE
ncbi:hypothetical protein HPB52_021921 [Rhipicephalus sanguineus]|uniref:Uncharacterized protein n=1 Tax=Rhipicephalus sanguineus TaxID=34632 RepID=A0A9D4QH30_RHISA|nr:hypothetical protein HPB52_021921 [Rhipicephalus sanguineus]